MKRRLAIVLAALLVVQPVAGSAFTAAAAEQQIVLPEETNGGMAGEGIDPGQGDSVQPQSSIQTWEEQGTGDPQNGSSPDIFVSVEDPADPSFDASGTEASDQSEPLDTEELPESVESPESAETPETAGESEESSSETLTEPSPETSAEPSTDMTEAELADEPADDVVIVEDEIFLDGIQPVLELTEETESESESESGLEFTLEEESMTETAGLMLLASNELAGKSFLEVKLTASHPAVREHTYTVAVTGPVSGMRTLALPHAGGSSDVARFEVTPGTYTVTVSADKFASYTQEVTVGQHQTARIEVENVRTGSTTDKGATGQKGWLRLGDVNGDGDVTQEDVKEILGAMRSTPLDPFYNLNDAMDEIVDIADLQYAVQSAGESQEATVMLQSLPQEVLADPGTNIDGAENLLSDAGMTQLAPTAQDAAISEANPVTVGFAFAQDKEKVDIDSLPQLGGMTIKAPVKSEDGKASGSEIAAGEAQVEYSYKDAEGNVQEGLLTVDLSGAAQPAMFMEASRISTGTAHVEPDGSLVLDFGGQLAVKRVTIKITGTTKKEEKLVDIAKVEFVNNMADRIPAPELFTPTLNVAGVGNEEILVSWTPQTNVTGYELYVSGPVKRQEGQAEQCLYVSGTQYAIVSIQDKPIKNFAEYTVKVRSVNGEWKSGWSDVVKPIPQPGSTPASVDNVVATGGYRSIHVTWKDMDDANGYMVYYRRKEAGGDFYPVVRDFAQTQEGTGCLDRNSYTITGLDNGTEYELYVIGWNEKGWGSPSITALATTESGDTPLLPQYRLINTSQGQGVLSAHIVSAICGNHRSQKMVESRLDDAKREAGEQPSIKGTPLSNSQWAYGVADDDYVSYWIKNDWDDGVAYPVNDYSKGVTVTLDREYRMNYLTFTAADITGNPERARVVYWNSDTGVGGAVVENSLIRRLDKNNRPYYIVKFHEAVTADQVQLCIGTGYASIDLKIGEIHFHEYDPLDDEIMNLYTDAMHTTLRDGVTEEEIDELERRLNIPDVNGEFHPLYDSLLLELKAARELLEMKLDPVIAVDSRITARRDGQLGFGGLNAWQPVGRTAATGETLVVYVGHNVKNIGESTNLRLVFTQYHAEANSLAAQSAPLKVGRNQVIVPKMSGNDFERGGQIYVAYDGNNPSDKYGIRINGGVKIPVLNIYRKQGAEKTAAIAAYVAELEQYVQTISAQHEANHKGKANVDYAYNEKNCILNATDLMMEHMMYSVPATQVWNAISGAGDKTAQLERSLDAMEQMMKLFYQHKGLTSDASAGSANQLPSQHLNIRYMRMFAGAFMYASGNHIGIEWDQTNVAGAAQSWDSFGWGIAHEIGHDINQSSYAIAEITNNYFAQLITRKTNGTRFKYEDVYKKVTSGAVGRHPNVGVQLALYWQLHLAYDDQEDRHLFENYRDQFDNLFFARVDTYARNPKAAPKSADKEKAKELTLGKSVDQNLMRLSCAAAEKNILSFFERWGMAPDEITLEYAQQFEDEQKALYYVNDDARDYRAAHPGADTGSLAAQVTAEVSAVDNQVKLAMNTDAADPGLILGYEVIRGMYSDGERQSEVVGFIQADESGSATFVDTISTIDNRVMYYEVRAVDKFLNYSEPADAGFAKISTGGALGKDAWTVETTMTSADDTDIVYDQDDPDGGFDKESGAAGKKSSIARIIDNDRENDPYRGNSEGNAQITIDMHKISEVTSVRYMGSDLESVSVFVSRDGENWTNVKKDHTGCKDCMKQFHTIWFDAADGRERDKWISIHDARYVRLEIPQSGEITISEIDICGPSGDDIEFFKAEDDRPAVGILETEFVYGKDAADKIPAGSLIFAGTYKGNPAYNVVMLYDTEGHVIGARNGEVRAEQIILAPDPKGDDLGDVSEGYWIYYVRPSDLDKGAIAKIKGVRAELYRVDNAHSLEGERVVSDTGVIEMPKELPSVSLTGVTIQQE